MSEDKKKTEYDSGAIQFLKDLEGVRKRPAMYIGDTAFNGMHHLLWEIVDNSVDEVMNGHASRIVVTLHEDGSTCTVAADGAASIVVAADTFTDTAGNDNTVSNTYTWTQDDTKPTMTITSSCRARSRKSSSETS